MIIRYLPFDGLIHQAQLLIQYEENNNFGPVATVEEEESKKDKIETSGKENSNDDSDGDEDIEIDINGDSKSNEDKDSELGKYVNKNFDPAQFQSNEIMGNKIDDPDLSPYENSKRREMAFKMLDSWNDKKYSHLRTFKDYAPMFSNKDRLYDHSTRSMVFDDDEIFVCKDAVTHLGKRTYNVPSDFIRLRFNADNIKEDNGVFDFFYKLTIMKFQIGGIWKDIQKKDFVKQSYKLSDIEYSTQNRIAKYAKAKADWEMRHNRVFGNYNAPGHPGTMPELTPISEMNDNDKVNHRTGSIFHINVEKADCGATFKPIKNGIIFWNENINLSNYVDLFFQIDSKFTKTPNWQQIMVETFNNWQREREEKECKDSVEISKSTSMTILEPQKKYTISIKYSV